MLVELESSDMCCHLDLMLHLVTQLSKVAAGVTVVWLCYIGCYSITMSNEKHYKKMKKFTESKSLFSYSNLTKYLNLTN